MIRHSVEFVVVGGFAAVAHGATLLTQDMDLWRDKDRETILQLRAIQERTRDRWPAATSQIQAPGPAGVEPADTV